MEHSTASWFVLILTHPGFSDIALSTLRWLGASEIAFIVELLRVKKDFCYVR
ncbi:hypothetical protein BBP40_010722, partial [Aspergillus hancockii]